MTDWWFCRWQSWRPSRSAQTSAMKLLAWLTCLENPLSQFPWSSLIRPPHPAAFKRSEADPSVFNLTQPESGFSHLIYLIILVWFLLGRLMHKAYSVACMKMFFAKCGFAPLPLKTIWLCWCQISQIEKGNNTFQGGWFEEANHFDLALVFSQSVIPWEKKLVLLLWTPRRCHVGFTTLQSRRAWIMDSFAALHIGQEPFNCIPLAAMHSFTPMAWCKHFHMNIWILGGYKASKSRCHQRC